MDERPSLFADNPALSDTMDDEAVAYRPVSTLAVLGAVLGLLSPLAFFSRFFLPLPALGAVLSLVAARGVQRDSDAKTGAGVAAFGLALSLAVLVAVLVREPLAQSMHADDARVVATRFLDALAEGDTISAYELTLRFSGRRPSRELAGVYYDADPSAQTRLQDFAEKPGVARLAAEDAPRPEFLSSSETFPLRGGRVSNVWLYRVAASGDEPAVNLRVTLERPVSTRLSAVAWRVEDFAIVPIDD